MANERKKKSVKCPVCGRFTSEESVKRVWEAKNSRITALTFALDQANARVENLAEWNKAKNIENSRLKRELDRAKAEIERLYDRNWWQRLRNKREMTML